MRAVLDDSAGYQTLRPGSQVAPKGHPEVPQRYMLDFLKLEWAVTTGTLRPVELSFGFDSGAMFRILSEDIYDGDRYVFLRELLQNSIDAIRTRRRRHEQRARGSSSRKRSGPSFDATIYLTAEHQSNGDFL
jgi:hypothetical protein